MFNCRFQSTTREKIQKLGKDSTSMVHERIIWPTRCKKGEKLSSIFKSRT